MVAPASLTRQATEGVIEMTMTIPRPKVGPLAGPETALPRPIPAPPKVRPADTVVKPSKAAIKATKKAVRPPRPEHLTQRPFAGLDALLVTQ